LNSNLFKFKYFYLITELPLERLLLHGCWLAGAVAWLAVAWPALLLGWLLPGRRCCPAVWLSLAGCLLLLARFNHDLKRFEFNLSI